MDKQVRLTKIYVKKLFNRFTYEIDLDNGNDVGIFIAPNGCGKTTIFRLVDYIFNPSIENNAFVAQTPFEICTCTLSNGACISLEKREAERKKKSNKPPYVAGMGMGQLEKEGKELFLVFRNGTETAGINLSDEMVDMFRRSLREDMPDAYVDRFLENVLDEEMSYGERMALSRAETRALKVHSNNIRIFSRVEQIRKSFNCDLDINFITADRLHKEIPLIKDQNRGSYGRRGRGYEDRKNDPLGTIQDNFTIMYKNTDELYKKLVSEARDKLPKMYLDITDRNSVPDYSLFEKEWKEYVADMERFCELGLMEQTQQILKMSELKKAYQDKGAFLSVYLDVFKRTLQPWHEQYDKLKLFTDILNKRNQVTLKQLKYSPYGLKLIADGVEIPLDCMSSGEKNDLIMFYNLIFNSKDGGLVLIDEPEISLHIEWQEEYLDRLISICKMNHLQAIVATHSPNIVNGHFELYANKELIDERR